MPQYHRLPNNWHNRGKIKIVYHRFWRNLSIIGKRFPYFVGDRVRFRITTERPNTTATDVFSHDVIYEMIGGEQTTLEQRFDDLVTEFQGSRIVKSGDIAYFIGRSDSHHAQVEFFTAKVENPDIVWSHTISKIIWAIIGGIISLLVAIISGLIDVRPIIRMFITP